MTSYRILNSGLKKQHGVSLSIVLILLLIMTLLGLASMRGALMQEKMSANQFDRSLGFQAAEAALRTAEARLEPTPPATFSATCTTGLCTKPAAGSVNRWDDAATAWSTLPASGTNPPARYIIEAMGAAEIPNPRTSGLVGSTSLKPVYQVFRITAESQGDGRSRILLQSNYSTPSP